MTEERKQKLRQLLNEAMMCLEIRRSGTKPSLLPMQVYRMLLQQRWTSYSEDLGILIFDPHIVSETTKSKLLDFIRVEFAPFIHEDRIQSAIFFLSGGLYSGDHLERLLEQLLKIAIVRGIEGAVSAFDRCTKETHGSFQYIALLEGIRLEAEIQVFEGMRLVPLSRSTSELPYYLPNLSAWYEEIGFPLSLHKKTLLIIDASISPIFQKPDPELFRPGSHDDDLPFQVGAGGGQFPNFKVEDFYEKFCQALSLACHSAVQISVKWPFLAADELFNLRVAGGGSTLSIWAARNSIFGGSIKVRETQIKEAKRLYHILVNLDSNIREKLRIPIDRWLKSKTDENPVDKMIDLGIALEALYVPDSGRGEIRFKLAVRAAWHLGKDKDDRNNLLTKFKQIYDHRSNAVHSGQLDEKVKFGKGRIPISEFIEKARDLCHQSIMKILEDGQFPNWNDLILGGEVGSAAVGLDENPGGLG